MRFKKLSSILLIINIMFIGFTCSDSSSSTQPATVNGRVEGNNSQSKAKTSAVQPQTASSGVEGAVVTAGRVQSDGTIKMIDGAKTTTEADGSYSLNVDASANSNVVVIAEKNSQKWKAYVSSQLQSGSTVEAKPMNTESTAETDVLTKIVAQGNSNYVTVSDIEAYVDANLAAQIQGNSEAESEVAGAIVEEANARAKYFAQSSVDVSQQTFQQALKAKAQAQTKLEARLNEASSMDEEKAAYDAFFKSNVSAYTDTGINLKTYAKAKEFSNKVLLKNSASLSSEAKASLRANSAIMTAVVLDNAAQAELKAMNASDSGMQAAVDAGATLRSNIRAYASATADDIKTEFKNYHDKIIQIMDDESSADSGVVVNIDADINASNGPKATLDAAISATASTNVVLDAYTTFYNAIQTMVKNNLNVNDSAEADATTQLLILINASS